MECFCCKRRKVLPMNCNCERITCRQCLRCARHCVCGWRARLPECASEATRDATVITPLRGTPVRRFAAS
jgi:hypothetical protein